MDPSSNCVFEVEAQLLILTYPQKL